MEMVIYYELCYSVDKERIKKFITLHLDETQKKTSEVLGDSKVSVHMQFHIFSSSKEQFLSELKKATACI